jgi:hypothetical protein
LLNYFRPGLYRAFFIRMMAQPELKRRWYCRTIFSDARRERNLFVAFRSRHHGDTAGAAALGVAKMFSVDHEIWRFPVRTVGSIEELEKIATAPMHHGTTIGPRSLSVDQRNGKD